MSFKNKNQSIDKALEAIASIIEKVLTEDLNNGFRLSIGNFIKLTVKNPKTTQTSLRVVIGQGI